MLILFCDNKEQSYRVNPVKQEARITKHIIKPKGNELSPEANNQHHGRYATPVRNSARNRRCTRQFFSP
ncbi:MAG: hypothetical protein SH857_18665 [Chitinophagales bacterium]|nr:hypothetical protein [Chitinophagales bacterium]